jgi:hypothetical protein
MPDSMDLATSAARSGHASRLANCRERVSSGLAPPDHFLAEEPRLGWCGFTPPRRTLPAAWTTTTRAPIGHWANTLAAYRMVFIELTPFVAFRQGRWTDAMLGDLQRLLLAAPDAGDLIPGGGWATKGPLGDERPR